MGMAEDAVEVLNDLIQPGVADAVRLKAVENVLNRSGIKEALEFKVEVSNVSHSEEIVKKLALMRERMSPAPVEDLTDEGEILDAEE